MVKEVAPVPYIMCRRPPEFCLYPVEIRLSTTSSNGPLSLHGITPRQFQYQSKLHSPALTLRQEMCVPSNTDQSNDGTGVFWANALLEPLVHKLLSTQFQFWDTAPPIAYSQS